MERKPDYMEELEYIGKVLLGQIEEFLPKEEHTQCLHFAMRFQQLSGPLMAKGFEDTLLYVYNRLLSLNDVGSEPDRFGVSLEAFHSFNQQRREHWPYTLNATATHDTKRGEDVRARLNVLSEIPQEWTRQVRNWNRSNRGLKKSVKRKKVPDKNDELFLYQTLVGAWPLTEDEKPDFVQRLKDYLIKAVREAKVTYSLAQTRRRLRGGLSPFRRPVAYPPARQPISARIPAFSAQSGTFWHAKRLVPDLAQDNLSRCSGLLPGD